MLFCARFVDFFSLIKTVLRTLFVFLTRFQVVALLNQTLIVRLMDGQYFTTLFRLSQTCTQMRCQRGRPLPLEFQGERNRQRRSVSDPACVAFLLAISCLVSAGAWNLVFTFLNW